jgi:hypothetical protein
MLSVPAEGMLIAVTILTAGCIVAGITGKGMVAPIAAAITRLVAPRHTDAVDARVRRAEIVLVSVLHDDRRRLGALLVVELAGHALLVLEIAVVLHALGFGADAVSAFIVEGGVKCIGALFFFVPGQIGISEGVYALLLPLIGLPAAAGVTIALVRRLRALAVGGVGFLLFARGRSDV